MGYTDEKISANEIIAEKMVEDKDFCFSIVKCKDREEVKKFLAYNGVIADDNDIDYLAKNISEVADICKKLDDKDLDKIVGGSSWDTGWWRGLGEYGAKIAGGAALTATGLLLITFIGAGIKKLGDEKGWWNKDKNKTGSD